MVCPRIPAVILNQVCQAETAARVGLGLSLPHVFFAWKVRSTGRAGGGRATRRVAEERLLARNKGAKRPRAGNVGGGSGLPLAWTVKAQLLPKASRRKSAQRSNAARPKAGDRQPLKRPSSGQTLDLKGSGIPPAVEPKCLWRNVVWEDQAMDRPEQLAGLFAQKHREHLPGLLESVIITGSAALDDWHPRVSDVDLVMVIARPMTSKELTVATRLHAESKSSTTIDGIYLTESQINEGPDRIDAVPQVVDGDLTELQAGGELTWVTWREIENGIEAEVTDTGAQHWARSERRFSAALEGAQQFSRENLASYWSALGVQSRTKLAPLAADAPVNASTVRWIALGPTRLLATIETGEILSKTNAGAFAARRWPKYADLLRRAAASRTGRDVAFNATDANLAVDLLEQCVATGRDTPLKS